MTISGPHICHAPCIYLFIQRIFLFRDASLGSLGSPITETQFTQRVLKAGIVVFDHMLSNGCVYNGFHCCWRTSGRTYTLLSPGALAVVGPYTIV